MIKINLAQRKQSASVQAPQASKGFSLSALIEKLKGGNSTPASSREVLAAVPVRRFALSVVLCAGAYFYVEDLKEEELKGWQDKVKVVQTEQNKMKKELAATKDYDQIKKSIDADEALLRNKIKVIQTLLSGRQAPHEILLTLATSIPKEVWLKGVKIENTDVTLRGMSVGFNQISTFMRSLGESTYFADVRLQSSQQDKDDGKELTAFELAAKRRGMEFK